MRHARLRLIQAGYHGLGQSLRGYLADAQQLTQFGIDDLPPRGLDFDETVRVRDLLAAAIEVLDEEKGGRRSLNHSAKTPNEGCEANRASASGSGPSPSGSA